MKSEAEIYRNALLAIRAYCSNAIMGRWRHAIVAIVDAAIKQGDTYK